MENKKKFTPNPDFKMLDQVRETLHYYHYSRSTEKTYCQWITRYIYFFEKNVHPKDMGEKEIERFLSHLATHEKVAASTQRQALNALVFLYHDVLLKPLDNSIAPVRSKRKNGRPLLLLGQANSCIIATNLNSLKSQPWFCYHESLINEMQACQLFCSIAITYLLVTPGMLFFCIVGTTTGLKRWDNMGAWRMWAINGAGIHRHLPNLAILPFSANGIETMSGPG
jgi:hypothetical protein